jgi:hypothetical protein
MEPRKLALYIILITSIIALLSQTPMIQAIGRGQHTFVSGKDVDCIVCHRYDAFDDMNTSQKLVLEAHKRAAGNKNYTTYLEVGGISYDPAGLIYSKVDSDNNGTSDTWIWNGSMWVYNNTARLYDLDLDNSGAIEGAEICKLCHSLDLMGMSGIVSAVHTIGTRYCDDDRCHGNRNYTYGDYRLFTDGRIDLTAAGRIISNNSVHGNFYKDGAGRDSNKTALHSYGIMPGNAAPGNVNNISVSPYTCLGCHSYINVSGNIVTNPIFNHSDTSYQKRRYT